MKIRHSFGMCLPLLLCLVTGAIAQNDPKSAASMTVLLMTSDIQVAADGSDTKIQHIEVRAGNDAGALQIGQMSIPFDAAAQDIAVVEAYTRKPDGKTLPVDASAIYDQAPPGQTALLVTGLRAKLIVFPQFAGGDTAVYTIKITTRHPNFAGQFVYGELFPRTQAFNEVRETITAPKSFSLYVESHDVEFSKHEDGANVIYAWHYAAPRPLAEEPVTFSPLDHTPRFFASSFKDYAQMGQAYAALAEPKRVVTPKIKVLADEITSGTSDPKAQVQKLYEWVSAHIRYVGIELGTGSYVPHDVDMIVANGYGDCKDHDILLQALLKAKGIDAQSILINGGASYSLTDVPTFTTLNHVITFVPQFNLYLDSSVGVAPFGILPIQEYGKPMVVASAVSASLGKMPLLAPGIGKVALKTVATLDKDGALTGTTTTTASGPYAITLRLLGLQIQGAGPTAATRFLTAMGYENASGVFTQDLPTGFSPDYAISSTFRWTGWADNLSGKNSFFMPPGLRLLGLSGDDTMGPFDPGSMSSSEPTVCISAEQSEDLSLKAPPGFQFNGLPNDTRIETPNLQFVAHWSLAGDTLNVHRDFTSKIDQPLCTGTIRAQSAAALKRIADSYNINISFATGGGTNDAAANAKGFYNSGYSLLNAGQYELAIVDFDKAIALKPDDLYTRSARGNARLYLKRYAQAIEDFDQAIKLDPDALDFNGRASAHEGLGQQDLALADYDKAIALKPDNASFYSSRGLVYARLRQYDRAVADLTEALKREPENAEYFAYRAHIYVDMGKFPTALEDFSQAIALKPDLADAIDGRRRVYITLGLIDRAFADFDETLRQKPDANAYGTRGRAYNKFGQSALALKDFDQEVKLNPDGIIGYIDRGIAFSMMAQYDRAVPDFDQVLVKQPDNLAALVDRATAYGHLDRYAEAIADYDHVLKLKPDFTGAYFNRCGMRLSANLDLEGALADCARVLVATPNDGNMLLEHGMANYRLGRFAEAIKDCEFVLAQSPRDLAALYLRGLAKARNGDKAGGDADLAASKGVDNRGAEYLANYGVKP